MAPRLLMQNRRTVVAETSILMKVKELHEYDQEYPVEIWHDEERGYTLVATNEGGCAATLVDLPSLIRWILDNFTKGEDIEKQIKSYIEEHAPSGASSNNL